MPSTLKVYVAAISAFHATIDGPSVGKHDLVIRFLRGARRLMALFHCMVRHGTVRYGSLLGGFPLGTVPGT